MRVELTSAGSLVLPRRLWAEVFGCAPSALVSADSDGLRLTALGPNAVGGLLFKQRNAAGDRSILVIEHLRAVENGWTPGPRTARWDAAARTLRVPLASDSPVPAPAGMPA